MDCQRVTQAMWTLERNAETAFSNQGVENSRDSRTLQRTDGSSHSQEDPSMRRGRRSPPQMLRNRGGDFVGQRQVQERGSFALLNLQAPLSPKNVMGTPSLTRNP